MWNSFHVGLEIVIGSSGYLWVCCKARKEWDLSLGGLVSKNITLVAKWLWWFPLELIYLWYWMICSIYCIHSNGRGLGKHYGGFPLNSFMSFQVTVLHQRHADGLGKKKIKSSPKVFHILILTWQLLYSDLRPIFTQTQT